jgi:predicted site-specific integrase-resolvase
MRKPKRNQDRTLVPVALASRLGISVSVLAGWMRAAGVNKDGPHCESDAREWRANPDSGPGWLRSEFPAICKAREQRGRLLAEHPDRLASFGAGLIEYLLRGFGVTVVYTGRLEDKSAEPELVRDMLAIVTSFAGRWYGQRSAKARWLRAVVAAETRSSVAA